MIVNLFSYEHQDYILNYLLSIIREKYGLIAKFGVEVEFYILDQDGHPIPDSLGEKLITEAALSFHDLHFCKEKGKGQYEFSTKPFEIAVSHRNSSVEETKQAVALFIMKSRINSKPAQVEYHPKPFSNDYGSSMHIHLTLHKDEENIFTHCPITQEAVLYSYYNKLNSKEGCGPQNQLLNVISSILHLLNQALYFLCGEDEVEYSRFQPGYMAPINLSWGGNNRTTAIRIPSTSPRRLEFRVPSARSNFTNSVIFLLTAVLDSLARTSQGAKELVLPSRVYGNAQDYQEFEKLYTTKQEAKLAFNLDKVIKRYLDTLN